jgi:hypothetical protein
VPDGITAVEVDGSSALPVGSRFNKETGVFSWQLHSAFLEEYLMSLVTADGEVHRTTPCYDVTRAMLLRPERRTPCPNHRPRLDAQRCTFLG